MLRFLIAAAAAVLLLASAAPAQQTPEPVSQVFFAQNDQSADRFEEDRDRSRAMVDALVIAVTGQNDLNKAWRSLVTPADRVGIKISAAGGRSFSTHKGIVAAVAAGLSSVGIPREHIIVWDRNAEDLRAAGYLPRGDRYDVQWIDGPRGYDRAAPITAPVLGKLMWGDLLFAEKQRVPFGKIKNDGDQLSSTSYLATIVSRGVTKIINVPTFSDERGCGVAGAIYNVTVPNVDNWRRFTQTDGPIATSPAELYADERIGPKCVLHIMDGLLAEFAGGPAFSPTYSVPYQTIFASKDPVALDALAMRKIDAWRVPAKLPSVAKQAAWLEEAAQSGLGNFAEDRIALHQVAVEK